MASQEWYERNIPVGGVELPVVMAGSGKPLLVLVIPLLIPIALKGVKYRPVGADALLRRNLLIWGLGGVIAPFIGIKLIDVLLTYLRFV